MSLDFTMHRFADFPLHPDTDVARLERLPLGTVAEVRDLISGQLPGFEWESFYTGFRRSGCRFGSDLGRTCVSI